MNRYRNAGLVLMLVVVVCVAGCMRNMKVNVDGDNVHVETAAGVVDVNGEDGKVSVKSKDGSFNAEVSEDGNKVEYTAESKEGKMKMTTDVDLKTFGELAYPGAEAVTGYDMQGADHKTAKSVTMNSKDPLSKVVAYYKGKVSGGDVVDMSSTSGMVMLNRTAGDNVESVVLTKDDETGGTIIVVTVSSK